MRRHLIVAVGAGAAVASVLGLLAVRTARDARTQRSDAQLQRSAPRVALGDEFASAASCEACHPEDYASWHRTYHRTMTQLATPEAVRGEFDGRTLELRGRRRTVERRGDEFWVSDPDAPEGTPTEQRIALVTGSHHMQVYWVPADNGRLESFPFAYLLAERRWVPNEATLLRPPEQDVVYTWNRVCIRCHAVAGRPGYDPATGHAATSVAELGISCEACHGPAHEHVRRNHDAARRYRHHLSDASDPTIVEPGKLPGHQAAQVCGQCHGFSLLEDEQAWLAHGSAFRAGDELSDFVNVVRHPANAELPWVTRAVEEDATFLAGRFWPDGMVRVAGREYNGLIESPCYASPDFSCLSCHSLHGAEPDDLLDPDKPGDEACFQCHEDLRADVSRHTHHDPESTGSRCYNCHMPHTTYGLLKAIRSHEVDSPSVAVTQDTGRPNACNLCHLDRSLGWTADALARLYGHEPVALTEDEQRLSAAALWLVRGDAGQRALAAWHTGWRPALDTAGDAWQAPLLAQLLDDPYPAVRFIAHRSLRELPGQSALEYDHVGPPADRKAAVERARELWRPPARGEPRLLQRSSGELDRETLKRLLDTRDDRPVDLKE